MSFYLFLMAAAVCVLSAWVHGVWGRRIYLGFIKQTNLPPREKVISAVSWDVFTLMLLVSGGSWDLDEEQTLFTAGYNYRF